MNKSPENCKHLSVKTDNRLTITPPPSGSHIILVECNDCGRTIAATSLPYKDIYNLQEQIKTMNDDIKKQTKAIDAISKLLKEIKGSIVKIKS